MKETDSRSSSYHRSRHTSRSISRERYRDRDKRNRRDKERNRERDRKDKYSRKRRSRSRTSKSKKKRSKKYKRSRRSSSSSSTSSSSRSRSYSSSRSRRPTNSRESSARRSRTRLPSAETTIVTTPITISSTPAKPIDLNDFQVKAALETIEEGSFIPREFYSTRDREAPEKITDKVIIDLDNETVTVPVTKIGPTDDNDDQIFHPQFLGDYPRRMEKWIKKLYNYRQKSFHE